MELKIYNPQEEGFLKEIDWNYEELKIEIQGKANDYMNLVYTADQVKDAKKDRANLNKFVEALESKRKEIKKQITEPYQHSRNKRKNWLVLLIKRLQILIRRSKDMKKQQDRKNLKRSKKSMQKQSVDLLM